MKRDLLALVIHPYRTGLLPREVLRTRMSMLSERLADLLSAHHNLRFSLSLPGSLLSLTDPVALSRLNEHAKRSCLEWLTPGFTEPFMAFAPQWLVRDNIRAGLDTFSELVGSRPGTLIPGFSNWDPAMTETLRELGITGTILSRQVLPRSARTTCGYWVTEQNGVPSVIYPSLPIPARRAPPHMLGWLDRVTKRGHTPLGSNLLVVEYLLPLIPDDDFDPHLWLARFADDLKRLLLRYELVLMAECPARLPPAGLQYIPASLVFSRADYTSETVHLFGNRLLSNDTVGLLHRRLLDASDASKNLGDPKEALAARRLLYETMDINRFLPHATAGFGALSDRLWTFAKLAQIDAITTREETLKSGLVRITDLLRTGTKTIQLANRKLSVHIDYRGGGQVFGIDIRERQANVAAAHNPALHSPPQVLCPGQSYTSFIDHFLDNDCPRDHFFDGSAKRLGDFDAAAYDYAIKKAGGGARAVLSRQGTLLQNDRSCPIHIEKAIGIEGDRNELSFAIKLSNHSLTPYSFRYGCLIHLALPGIRGPLLARLDADGRRWQNLATDRISTGEITEWTVADAVLGLQIRFFCQKPVTLWCVPVPQYGPCNGTAFMLSSPVQLEAASTWNLMGRITFRTLKTKSGLADAV